MSESKSAQPGLMQQIGQGLQNVVKAFTTPHPSMVAFANMQRRKSEMTKLRQQRQTIQQQLEKKIAALESLEVQTAEQKLKLAEYQKTVTQVRKAIAQNVTATTLRDSVKDIGSDVFLGGLDLDLTDADYNDRKKFLSELHSQRQLLADAKQGTKESKQMLQSNASQYEALQNEAKILQVQAVQIDAASGLLAKQQYKDLKTFQAHSFKQFPVFKS